MDGKSYRVRNPDNLTTNLERLYTVTERIYNTLKQNGYIVTRDMTKWPEILKEGPVLKVCGDEKNSENVSHITIYSLYGTPTIRKNDSIIAVAAPAVRFESTALYEIYLESFSGETVTIENDKTRIEYTVE